MGIAHGSKLSKYSGLTPNEICNIRREKKKRKRNVGGCVRKCLGAKKSNKIPFWVFYWNFIELFGLGSISLGLELWVRVMFSYLGLSWLSLVPT